MKNILAAIDFKGHEEQIIETATKFARTFGSKIWLIHIAAPDPDFVGYEPGPQYIRDCRATTLKKEHELLETYCNEFSKKGIEAEGLLIQGATVEMIMKESKKLHIDLIIIGHAEHSFIYKAIFGNISKAVIQKSTIPVLTVPLD